MGGGGKTGRKSGHLANFNDEANKVHVRGGIDGNGRSAWKT